MGAHIGVLHTRRALLIKAAPERVWEEFTSHERMDPWFGRGHVLEKYEPVLGGRVELSIEPDGKLRRFGGPVTVLEPTREITFEVHWLPPAKDNPATFFTLRLTPVYSATLVEIFDHGFERFGDATADHLEGVESSWTAHHLQALRRIIEG